MTADVIDSLAGVAPGSKLDLIRRARPKTRENAQASYDALFAPADPRGVSPAERLALAAFTAGLSGAEATGAHYAAALAARDGGLAEAVDHALRQAAVAGPYGLYPPGPLSRENQPGPAYRADQATADRLGARLAAALEHAHLLVLHPRDAGPADLAALASKGWTTPEIVTLSQIVAFVSFQGRLVAGLAQLAAA
jgi:CMD domain protein